MVRSRARRRSYDDFDGLEFDLDWSRLQPCPWNVDSKLLDEPSGKVENELQSRALYQRDIAATVV